MSLRPAGLRGAPGYSLEQAHHLPIEMDPLIGEYLIALRVTQQLLLQCYDELRKYLNIYVTFSVISHLPTLFFC